MDTSVWALGGDRARNVHSPPCPHCHPLCPQASAFVLGKAWPAPNYSSSSPPSSRTSPWPAPWPLRTSTSHPGRAGWAECPHLQDPVPAPPKKLREGGPGIPGSCASPPLWRRAPCPAASLPPLRDVLDTCLFPLLTCLPRRNVLSAA